MAMVATDKGTSLKTEIDGWSKLPNLTDESRAEVLAQEEAVLATKIAVSEAFNRLAGLQSKEDSSEYTAALRTLRDKVRAQIAASDALDKHLVRAGVLPAYGSGKTRASKTRLGGDRSH